MILFGSEFIGGMTGKGSMNTMNTIYRINIIRRINESNAKNSDDTVKPDKSSYVM